MSHDASTPTPLAGHAEITLKPCPFCGAEMWIEGGGWEHPRSKTCPLDCLYIEDRHVAAWNKRPEADAAWGAAIEAAKTAWANAAHFNDAWHNIDTLHTPESRATLKGASQ